MSNPYARFRDDQFVFCDGAGCDSGWHLSCAGEDRTQKLGDYWFCPGCKERPKERLEPREFRAVRRPQLDKELVRIKAGLDPSAPVSRAEVDVLLAAAEAESTRVKK